MFGRSATCALARGDAFLEIFESDLGTVGVPEVEVGDVFGEVGDDEVDGSPVVGGSSDGAGVVDEEGVGLFLHG